MRDFPLEVEVLWSKGTQFGPRIGCALIIGGTFGKLRDI